MNASSITSKSSPLFRISTFRNEEVLIFEPPEYLTTIRIMMVIISILIGIVTLINLVLTYIKNKTMFKHGRFYRIIIPLVLFLNILFHMSHYAHNIYDPVGYFEPKLLYRKLLVSEMEQTFLFNFPLSIIFMIATRKLLLSCTKQHTNFRNMFIVVALYCLMSMISGGHYTNEPPWNFSLINNMTIAGETIVALLLLIMALFIYRSNTNKIIKQRYTRLATTDQLDSNMPMLITPQRQFKSKLSDNE